MFFYRISRPEVYCEKSELKSFAKNSKNSPLSESFVNKVTGQRPEIKVALSLYAIFFLKFCEVFCHLFCNIIDEVFCQRYCNIIN